MAHLMFNVMPYEIVQNKTSNPINGTKPGIS